MKNVSKEDERTLGMINEMFEVVKRQTGDPTADANRMAVAQAAAASRVNRPKADMEPLSRKFRRLTRELMNDEAIQELIKQRVIQELSGGTKDTHVTCTLMRIASGTQNLGAKIARTGEERWLAPSLHVHLDKLSDEQLKGFYEQGIRPKLIETSTSTKTIDVEE